MISRRNIRVKVMQTLYTLASRDHEEQDLAKQGKKLLDDRLNNSLDLFTTAILYIIRTAQYVEQSAANRGAKYLPTAEDLNVNTRIAANTFIWSVLGNETFKSRVKDRHLERFVQDEWLKKLYNELAKTPEYQEYIKLEERSKGNEKAIVQFIWEKLMLPNENLQDFFTDELPGWEDDKDMIRMLMENFFRQPNKVNFLSLLSDEKRQYAQELLATTLEKKDYLMQLVSPKLVNWDPERVALIDLLVLRMGVAELLYFPTIPTKVTINEYIDIAKQYSTLQSGQFVNGVLDNVLKDLERNNLINKQDRFKK